MRRTVVGLACCVVALFSDTGLEACTAFCAVGRGQVLVGNNEDWNNPRSKVWFVPAKPGSYGRMYVGFDDLTPFGGMNEHGLWFDAFSAPPIGAGASADLPSFSGEIVETAMAECRTVEEVVRLFSRYNRNFLTEGILMFADASGDAVSIERNAMVRKTRGHFVQTNFHQSRPLGEWGRDRFDRASSMLEAAGEDVSIDVFRRILAATHQKGGYPTLYSNIFDLRSRTMYLYYFHDFDRVVTFNLADELRKGSRVLDIPALFPKNAEAEAFAARRTREAGAQGGGGKEFAIVALVMFSAVVIFSGYGLARSTRRVRVGVGLGVGVAVVAVVAAVIFVREYHQASPGWIQFSIAPASGDSASISTTTIRANGLTLKGAIATAYDIPAVRVIGPPWLGDTRYSINAVLGIDETDNFRPLLQQELEKRLGLETHVEVRPFEVFVLTAESPRLERAAASGPSTWISKQDVRMRGGSMQDLASAIQGILGRPVIDETAVRGSYDMEFDWGQDRVESVTATLRDRFGLRLSPGTRDMETLIVDRIRRDPALVLFDQVGRLTRAAPAQVRKSIADVLTMR